MKLLLLSSFTIILLFSNCSKRRDIVIPENIKKYSVENFDDKSFFQWNEFVAKIDVIQLETTDNSLLGDITKGVIDGNNIFIQDRKLQCLLNFDTSGKFIKKLGKKGQGPGEYLEIRDFCLLDDCIYTLDYRKIHSYNKKTGEYIESILFDTNNGFNPMSFIVYDKDSYFLWCSNPDIWNSENMNYYRMRDIKNGAIKAEYFKFEYAISDDPRFYQCGENSYYIKPIDGEDIIYKQTKDSITASFAIDFGELAISAKRINELKEDERRNAFLESESLKEISDILETENYIYFKCIGPETYRYEGIINKKNNELKLGKWDYKRSPIFFYSDGLYLYGYYEPHQIIGNGTNGNDLNTCFDEAFDNLTDVDASDNFILVKALLK